MNPPNLRLTMTKTWEDPVKSVQWTLLASTLLFYSGHQLMADEWVRTVKATWPSP